MQRLHLPGALGERRLRVGAVGRGLQRAARVAQLGIEPRLELHKLAAGLRGAESRVAVGVGVAVTVIWR